MNMLFMIFLLDRILISPANASRTRHRKGLKRLSGRNRQIESAFAENPEQFVDREENNF